MHTTFFLAVLAAAPILADTMALIGHKPSNATVSAAAATVSPATQIADGQVQAPDTDATITVVITETTTEWTTMSTTRWNTLFPTRMPTTTGIVLVEVVVPTTTTTYVPYTSVVVAVDQIAPGHEDAVCQYKDGYVFDCVDP